MAKLEDYVISIPDFPKEGIIFRDVTGILNHADGIQMSINGMVEKLKDVILYIAGSFWSLELIFIALEMDIVILIRFGGGEWLI